MYIHRQHPMFSEPPHDLINPNNPFIDYFDTIETCFTRYTTAAAGRIARQNYTDTKTYIKKRRRKNQKKKTNNRLSARC